MESHTSEMASQDSPLRRKFSEPLHAKSGSTKTTPSPAPDASICAQCGEHIEPSADMSLDAAIKRHMDYKHFAAKDMAPYNNHENGIDDESQTYDGDEDDEQVENGDMVVDQANGSPRSADYNGGNVEVAEEEPAEVSETYNGNKRAALDSDRAGINGDGEVPEGESDVALSNQLHEFSRDEDSASIEKRLHNLWNIHDVRQFTKDYDENTNEMNETWATVFNEAKSGKKRNAPEFLQRPDPYKATKVGRGEFLEMAPLEDFLSQLRDPELRTSDELYAITENVAYALKVWQDEFLAIDKLQKLATRHNLKVTSDPRKLERPQVFEDKKEAMLYGYKYDPKEDKIGNQNPFLQGGFKPTPAQYRKMLQKVGPNNPNPDGWRIISKFGVDHVPKFQNPPREDGIAKATRKRKAAELEAASRANESDEAAVTEAATPAEPDQDPAKRRSRNRRQGDEPNAENGRSSTPRGRGGRPRGRGAARGGSRAASEAPLAPAPVAGNTTGSTPVSEGLSQARTGASQLVPIEPAPNGGPATAPDAKPPAGGAQGVLDAAEEARRQKIANSKNPKRTEAMLNHWARFNREGRVRNPKRSKAQIEADRAADAARKASEGAKLGIKQKKKSASPALSNPPRVDAGLAPAPPQPMQLAPPPQLAPGPLPHPHSHPPPHPHPHSHTHTHTSQLPSQLPPLAAPRGLAPYPPPHLDPRPMPPFPLARGPGPLHQPPPQPYRTPYPDYFNSPYGPPPLPPPGHPRP
ncbi:hypothetical protein BDW67DRAFT_176469 [Aspergillus spinulosporus]